MVLKKSNSPFNSGTTQKNFFNRGIYRTNNDRSGHLLNITLKELPGIYLEDNPSTPHIKALEKIYEYLQFPGPDLKTFYTYGYEWRYGNTRRALSFSLDKHELWHIPERINQFMKEENFLDGEKGFAEIRVCKVRRIADRKTLHEFESRTLNPQKIKESESPSQGNRIKYEGNKRGLQRPHLFKPAKKDEYEEYYVVELLPLKTVVEVQLQQEDQIDARVLQRPLESRTNGKFNGKYNGKSKPKSCVNGKKSYRFKAYNAKQLRNEIGSTLNPDDFLEENDYCHYDGSDDDDDEGEIVRDQEEYCNNWDDLSLSSFVVIPKETRTPRKEHRGIRLDERKHANDSIETNDSKLVNVNSASSQITIRHPKGSFQLIERPSDVEEVKSTILSGEDGILIPQKNTLEESYDDISESLHQGDQKMDSETVQSPATFNTLAKFDKFVSVDLKFLNDIIKETMIDALLQTGCYTFSVLDCSVVLGNSYPPVFCVSLGDSHLGVDNGWSLVGTSSSCVSSYKDLKWGVTLKCTKTQSAQCGVKDHFFSNLHLNNNCVLNFTDLVQMALTSIGQEDKHNLSASKLAGRNHQDNLLPVSKCVNAQSYELCLVEEAITALQNVQMEKKENYTTSSMDSKNEIKISSEMVSCDVCFSVCDKYGRDGPGIIILLPCNHSFCFECWQSHIFYHLQSGNSRIPCMHTDCKETLNDTMMKALIPEDHLRKLFRQQQEKCIDTSPLCQWCPRPKCSKVAMIADASPHVKQFGCCVSCDCGGSWCFSCQLTPHWPASCGQAAAYRNILFKFGDEMPKEEAFLMDFKPCPGCRYGIEKDWGCPYMTCFMCRLEFCWNCLQPFNGHPSWECDVDKESTLVPYKLDNDFINTFPLKFLSKAIDIKDKNINISKETVSGWLNGLNCVDCRKIKLSFHRSVQGEEPAQVKARAFHLATDSIRFLKDSYSFLEYFYILFSFALLNKGKEKRKEFYISTEHLLDKLFFTTLRLEDMIVGKSPQRVLVAESTCKMYLVKGREMLELLKHRVALAQKLSKDVPAEPIGNLDPKLYFRYR